MKAGHIRLSGVYNQYEEAFAEMVIRLIEGVKDVASIRSLNLISVLYDESLADLAQILASVRGAGFRAYEYRPQRSGDRTFARA